MTTFNEKLVRGRNMNLKTKVSFIIFFSVFIPVFCSPLMSRADLGPYEDFYPESFKVTGGTYLLGDLNSAKNIDLDAIWVLASYWYYFFVFIYSGEVTFYFPNQICDYVVVAMVDNCELENFRVRIQYTYGEADSFPEWVYGRNDATWPYSYLGDGFYHFKLDDRPVKSVTINFYHFHLLGGARFFYIDQIACRNYN